jgi:uncharacterized protein
MTNTIVDTGILVAFLEDKDAWHEWSSKKMLNLPVPYITCEAVISEACFLVNHFNGREKVMKLLSSNAVRIDFSLQTEIVEIEQLMKKYADVPMSFADACLVRMSELHRNSKIFTLDSDFRIYRQFGKKEIPLIIPNEI